MKEDIIRCIEIYKRINEISYGNKEVESLWNEYVLIFKTLSHYRKSCLINFFINVEFNIINKSFFLNKSCIDTEMIYFMIHVQNNIISGDMFYNFKDVGCYVKYNDKIFKIEEIDSFGDITVRISFVYNSTELSCISSTGNQGPIIITVLFIDNLLKNNVIGLLTIITPTSSRFSPNH